MRILLVEDVDILLMTLQRIISEEGHHEVKAAASAEQAIGILKRDNQFDFVITDLRMFNKNGCDLIAYVKSEMPETTTVLMSSGNESKIRESNPDCAYDHFLCKEDADFIRKVLGIIDKRKHKSSRLKLKSAHLFKKLSQK